MRWGIIGAGDVTEVKSGPAFRRIPGVELVAVMRRNADLARDYARRHGVERWHCDADEILHADDIDAVYIATHPNTHAEYACRAAAAGKAVLVEKPMAVDSAQCHAMTESCQRAGVPLWVAYYRRALPRFEHVRKLVADGEIGAVRAVNSVRLQVSRPRSWQNTPGLSGGGWFFDAACHTLDWLDHLFGPLGEVAGHAYGHGRHLEDTVAASYVLPGGIAGSGTWCFDAGADLDRTMIVGTTGAISVSISSPDPIELVRGTTVQRVDFPDPPHVHEPLLRTIVDEWRGGGACCSTGVSAARTAMVVDKLLADVRAVAG
ncbi:gfo/Idh/MocA family oxidoreductase [Mycolicibacterium moriokaense]|nr:gfo/Idh/MocA family oxidoreductase [Mycolicibacterium moriokaense]